LRHFDLLDSGPRAVIIVLLLAIMLGSAVDLILDEPDTLLSSHVIFELCLIGLCLGTAIFLWGIGFQAERTLQRTRAVLAQHETELVEWRARAERLLKGLGAEIDRQMREWGLSPAEREVALLLL
jgi:hypothetical protein